MISVYIHPPKDANTSPPDYEIDSPAILAWWGQRGVVGGADLVPVRDLAAIISDEDHGGLGDVLWVMEETHCVMLVRRE